MENLKDLAEIAKLKQPVMETVKGRDGNDVTFAIIPNDMKAESLKKFADEYALKPERRKGTAVVKDIASFVALTNRFKTETSALFCDGNISGKSCQASLMAVINYNPASNDTTKADFGDHRVNYSFPISKYFKKWLALDGEAMSQEQFCQFLDDNIGDLVKATEEGMKGINFGGNPTPKFATPSDIFILSKGLEIRVGETVVDKRTIENGTGQIQYSTEHKTADGKPLEVPSWFVLGLEVFEDGDAFEIPVRLRYRVHGGKIVWFFEMYRVEDIFDRAFDSACDKASEETNLPLYNGAPEGSSRSQ